MAAEEQHRHESHAEGVIVFSSAIAKRLVEDRLPTTYVGVRRLRPSSRSVALAVAGKTEEEHRTVRHKVVYKIFDETTGIERRMTSSEKKAKKSELRSKKRKLEAAEPQDKEEAVVTGEEKEPIEPPDVDQSEASEARHLPGSPQKKSSGSGESPYVQLKVDRSLIEDEISDLRGEREGVPPVFLPPPISRLLSDRDRLIVKIDDEWAVTWGLTLKATFQLAEERRVNEELRPMPYHVVPEVWSRLRPETIGVVSTSDSSCKQLPADSTLSAVMHQKVPMDMNTCAILQLLHIGTGLHLSCGAKFGCDYLIYDGPRSQRHAFAGLRMVPSNNPYPTAYDLAGYVRTLNTAGKLALLATVEKRDDTYFVAILDLALIKIATTTFSKPRKTIEQRLQNLAK